MKPKQFRKDMKEWKLAIKRQKNEVRFSGSILEYQCNMFQLQALIAEKPCTIAYQKGGIIIKRNLNG